MENSAHSEKIAETINSAGWVIEIVIGIALLILVNYALKHLLKYLRRLSLSTNHDWKEKIEEIVKLPIRFILWSVGIVYVLGIVGYRFGVLPSPGYLNPLRNAILVLCLAWLLLRWKKEIQLNYKIIDPGMVEILGRLTTITIVFLAVLIILQICGLNTMPLVAFGGVGAAALGFAAKDVIANFFGGFMVHITRPFTVGDLIIIPSQNIEGHVEMIGWYLTAIRDKEKRSVYLPNSFFSTLLVINASRMSHRRIEEKIGIRYQDISKVEKLSQDIKALLSSHPSIDTHLPIIVAFNAFSAYSLEIYIDAYSLTTRYDEFLKIQQEIFLRIYDLVIKSGAEMPYPTHVALSS